MTKRFLGIIFLGLFLSSNAFALPDCKGTNFKKWTNCQGTYTWADGQKYVGEWKDRKQHGQGTDTYSDGSKYVGEYKDGKKYGQGTYTFADGTVEKGIWENGELVEPN